MGFSIQIADDSHQKEWDDYIQTSSFGTIFHAWEWLKIMEKHTNSTLYALEIFKGGEHVASYPIFYKKKGLVKAAFSPAYNTDTLYLGPVISQYESLNQPKKEEYLSEIQSAIDKFLFSDLRCNYVNLRTMPGLLDSRYLRWAGYHVEPLYSYRLDLNLGLNVIWNNLHRGVRKNIKNIQEKGFVVERGDRDDLSFIDSRIQQRFVEQGRKRNDISTFLEDVFQQYNGRNLDIFVAKYQGETVSGVIHLNYNGIMYQWVGLPKTEIDGISPNDLLVWESIKTSHEMGMRYYDIMDGGDNPRLRRFKSKFNPELTIWYSAEKYSHPIYEMARKVSQKIGYHVKI